MASKVPRLTTKRTFRQGFALGTVVAKHHSKTLRVAISRRVFDGKYETHFSRRTLYHVHDELNEAVVGDDVLIRQSKPHSKLKRHELVDIATRAPRANFLDSRPDIALQMQLIERGKHERQIAAAAEKIEAVEKRPVRGAGKKVTRADDVVPYTPGRPPPRKISLAGLLGKK